MIVRREQSILAIKSALKTKEKTYSLQKNSIGKNKLYRRLIINYCKMKIIITKKYLILIGIIKCYLAKKKAIWRMAKFFNFHETMKNSIDKLKID